MNYGIMLNIAFRHIFAEKCIKKIKKYEIIAIFAIATLR